MSDDDEDDGPSNPKHLNGCSACPEPRNRKGADIYWFPNGAAYLELCRAHWAELHAWLNGDAEPAQIETALAFLAEHAPRPPVARPVLTLEAFS